MSYLWITIVNVSHELWLTQNWSHGTLRSIENYWCPNLKSLSFCSIDTLSARPIPDQWCRAAVPEPITKNFIVDADVILSVSAAHDVVVDVCDCSLCWPTGTLVVNMFAESRCIHPMRVLLFNYRTENWSKFWITDKQSERKVDFTNIVWEERNNVVGNGRTDGG